MLRRGGFGRWKLNVECWMFRLWIVALALLSPGYILAQTPPQPDPLMQLMLTQPSIEISTNVEIRAVFDPPVIGVGEKSTYRVAINAVSDSIKWPDEIYAPSELTIKQSARGQILQPAGVALKPITTINHHVTATQAGEFVIPEFRVKVYGRNVAVPATRLVVSTNASSVASRGARLFMEIDGTNAFCGQPLKVRVVMPASQSNIVQALQYVQLNGDGILLDQSAVRQRIQQMEFNGRSGPAYIYESTLTPLVAGRVSVTAQAFTAGNQFFGGITIHGNATILGGAPQFTLLDSDAVTVNVEPLPRVGVLPGFNGAIGKFTMDLPQLETNRVRVGDPVKLLVTFRSGGEIKRLLAPTPTGLTNWQLFPPLPKGAQILTGTTEGISSAQTFSYTMIPLTNNMSATPAIPFSYFDPQTKSYVDLTIPSLPITVIAGAATAEAQAIAQAAAAVTSDKKIKLSALASEPGRTVASLVPLQQRGSFLLLQLVPLVGFASLWFWDRRRRYFELHPEILVRRKARHALRRERIALRNAASAGDATRFAEIAVTALRVVSAPHFPATPRALVGRDVLELLNESARQGRTGEVVKKFFAFTDAAQFSPASAEANELLGLQTELNDVLDELEAKL